MTVNVESVGVRAGDVLAGKYRIDRVLGAGGMGVVVAAHHIRLDEKVAIKFLLPEAMTSPEAVSRFYREARAAAKIKSEHVAHVSDVGTLENGAPYMVMEYLEGSDLCHWIEHRGPSPVEQAVEFVLQACDAIADAHSLGIVHRDLKPANLFCIQRNDGQLSIKVLDFGISKVTGVGSGSDMGMTKTATMMGSPYYMSPEQVQSAKDVDVRSDIWALGVILHELLVGTVPFGGDTIAGLVLRIMTAPPELVRQRRPDVPEALEAVIRRCLEKDRADRYQSVAELAVALVDFAPAHMRLVVDRICRLLNGVAPQATGPGRTSPSFATQALPVGTASSWGQTRATPPKKRGPALLIGAAVLIAGLGAASAVLLMRGPSRILPAEIGAGSAGLARTTVPTPSESPSPPPTTVAAPQALATSATASPEAPPTAAASPALPNIPVFEPPAANPAPPRTGSPRPGRPARPAPSTPTALGMAPAPAGPPTAANVPATAAPPQAPPPPAAPKVSCDPPYTIDGAGHRQYKVECLK